MGSTILFFLQIWILHTILFNLGILLPIQVIGNAVFLHMDSLNYVWAPHVQAPILTITFGYYFFTVFIIRFFLCVYNFLQLRPHISDPIGSTSSKVFFANLDSSRNFLSFAYIIPHTGHPECSHIWTFGTNFALHRPKPQF